jgi:hypothetical protein
MDKATTSYQAVLWHFRKRREDADLGRRIGVRPGCDRQEAIEHLGQPLRNATDLEPDHVEQTPLISLLSDINRERDDSDLSNQLNLLI